MYYSAVKKKSFERHCDSTGSVGHSQKCISVQTILGKHEVNIVIQIHVNNIIKQVLGKTLFLHVTCS